MEQDESRSMPGAENIDPQLSSVESTILALLQNHAVSADRIIDVPRLQKECLECGLSTQQFSHGFVRLLTRRLLEPRGDFTFSLAAAGREQ